MQKGLVMAFASVALATAVVSPAQAYQNGALPQSALAPIYYPGETVYLERDAAAAWNALRAHCRAHGVDIYPKGPNSAYRTLAQQRLMKKLYGSNAATPGTSNHGLGIAVDLATQEMRKAIDKYGAAFGWSKKWSDASWEWWHIKYKPGVWHGTNPGPGGNPNANNPNANDGDEDGLPLPGNPGEPSTGTTNPTNPSNPGGTDTPTDDGTQPGTPGDTSGLAGLLGDVSSRPTIKRGATGQDVSDLQRALKIKGYDIAQDGIFGPETDAAVRAFQKKNKLGADGVVGSKTWKALAKN